MRVQKKRETATRIEKGMEERNGEGNLRESERRSGEVREKRGSQVEEKEEKDKREREGWREGLTETALKRAVRGFEGLDDRFIVWSVRRAGSGVL